MSNEFIVLTIYEISLLPVALLFVKHLLKDPLNPAVELHVIFAVTIKDCPKFTVQPGSLTQLFYKCLVLNATYSESESEFCTQPLC